MITHCVNFIMHMQKFFFFFLLFFSFTIPLPAHAAVSWSNSVVESGVIASSTRVLWNSTLGEFAVGYTLSDGTASKFSSSTVGSAWANPVTSLSTTNLSPVDTFFTTNVGGTGYVGMGMITGATKKYLSSSNGGSTWNAADVSTVDHYISGQIQVDNLGYTYIAGRVEIGGSNEYVVMTKTAIPPASNFFTSSSIAGPLGGNPSVDFAHSSLSGGAVAYSIPSSGILDVFVSATMSTWTDISFTPSGTYSIMVRPRVKFDSNGVPYVIAVGSNNFPCSISCDVILSHYSGGSWTTEVVDTVGSFSNNAQHDLAFVNGTIPIITYYNKTTGALRYAYRDLGGSGCSGANGSSWTCGNVATGFTMPPTVAISTNNSTKVVIVYQNNLTAFDAAYATVSLPSSGASTVNSAFPKAVAPTDLKIVVNNGGLTSDKLEVPIDLSATNATEVALSTNPDFYNVAWQPLNHRMSIKLQNKQGSQNVYAKFANSSGGVSDVVFGTVYYIAPQVIMPEPIADTAPASEKPIESKPITAPPSVFPDDSKKYELFAPYENFDPFNPVNPANGTTVFLEKPSCPERINAFSLDGMIIQDVKKDLYLVVANKNVACPVGSYAVARSWGITSFKKGAVSGYQISSPLPYRPGTIVRNSKAGEMYFVNTKGKLHLFPNTKMLAALGYSKNPVLVEKVSVINMFTKSASLVRTDMHPDGTLFLIDAKKGEYGIIQNRVMHLVSRKTLLKFKENIGRAVRLLPGEQYETGDRWD